MMTTPKAFLHPTNFRHEISIKRLMNDLPGGIGYGVAMLVIETLAGQPGMRYPAEAVDLLAHDIGVSIPILNTVLTTYGIFEEVRDENGKSYICPSLNIWQEPYVKKVEINSLRGKKSAIKNQLRLQLQIDELNHTLSSSDSSQQIINKLINERSKKSLSKKSLKDQIINKYNNTGEIWEGVAGYTSLSIRHGYLHNNVTDQDLSPEDAVKVWGTLTYLYTKSTHGISK